MAKGQFEDSHMEFKIKIIHLKKNTHVEFFFFSKYSQNSSFYFLKPYLPNTVLKI